MTSLRRVCTKCSLELSAIFVIALRCATKIRSEVGRLLRNGFAVAATSAYSFCAAVCCTQMLGLAETSKASKALCAPYACAGRMREGPAGDDGSQGSCFAFTSVFTAASSFFRHSRPDGLPDAGIRELRELRTYLSEE